MLTVKTPFRYLSVLDTKRVKTTSAILNKQCQWQKEIHRPAGSLWVSARRVTALAGFSSLPLLLVVVGRTRSQVGPVSPAPNLQPVYYSSREPPATSASRGHKEVSTEQVESAVLTISWFCGQRPLCRHCNGSQKPAHPSLLCGRRDGSLSHD